MITDTEFIPDHYEKTHGTVGFSIEYYGVHRGFNRCAKRFCGIANPLYRFSTVIALFYFDGTSEAEDTETALNMCRLKYNWIEQDEKL